SAPRCAGRTAAASSPRSPIRSTAEARDRRTGAGLGRIAPSETRPDPFPPVPYSAEISRTAPAAVLLLLDRSASMQDPFGGAEEQGDAAPSKARVLADSVNRLIQNLVLRCAKEDGVRDYFAVGVIGYGDRVESLLRLADQDDERGVSGTDELIPISYLAERPLRIEERLRRVPDGAGGLVEQRTRFPVWFDPEARNGTPIDRKSTRLNSSHVKIS